MLIFFSLLSNQVAMGLVVLIVHDASDTFSALARAYIETKNVNNLLVVIKFVLMLGSWIYMRLIVYPFCLVKYTYLNTPSPTDMWYSIKYEHTTIVVMAALLIGMHAFWIYYMVLFGIKHMKKGRIENPHE
jgi:ceramide synthetase